MLMPHSFSSTLNQILLFSMYDASYGDSNQHIYDRAIDYAASDISKYSVRDTTRDTYSVPQLKLWILSMKERYTEDSSFSYEW